MTMSSHLCRVLPALRSALIPGLALALSACTPGESAPHAVPSSAPVAPAKNNAPAALQVNARLAALIQAAGATCTDATGCTAGNVDTRDFYDVEFLPDCGDKGFFAGVAQASRSVGCRSRHRQQRNGYSQSCPRPARLRPGDRPRRTEPAVLLRGRNSSEHRCKVREHRIVQNLRRQADQADQACKWRALPRRSTRTIHWQLRARMGECGRTRSIFQRNLVARTKRVICRQPIHHCMTIAAMDPDEVPGPC